jgi:hypothetical protein
METYQRIALPNTAAKFGLVTGSSQQREMHNYSLRSSMYYFNSPVSIHGIHQCAQNDVFVSVHENVQSASIVRDRDLVLLDDAIYGRSSSRLQTFSRTSIADVVALSKQTRRKTPETSLALAQIAAYGTVSTVAWKTTINTTIHCLITAYLNYEHL